MLAVARAESAMPSPASPPAAVPGEPSRTGTKVLLVLLATGLALAGAEVALRVLDPFGFRVRGHTLVLPTNVVYDIEADLVARTDQLDPHVVHTKNSLGFRGPEPPADFDRWLTLAAVGGSTTECFYLSDGKPWPARLAARLGPELDRLWVNNAGLDGHSTFGHLVLTRRALVPLRPDVTLYLVGVNEMFTDAPRDFDRLERSPVSVLAAHSALVATLENLYRHWRTRGIEDLGTMPKPVALRDRPRRPVAPEVTRRLQREHEPRLAAYRDRLERLVALNREHGMAPVLVTQPSLLGGVDVRTGIDTRTLEVELWETLDGELAWRLLERYNDVTREVGRRHGIPVVDLAREMPKDSELFYDFFHFTNEGADRAAAIVHDALLPWLAERFPRHFPEGRASSPTEEDRHAP